MCAQRECRMMTTSNSILPKSPARRSEKGGIERGSKSERIDRLLARYPNISGSEAAEILRFVRSARSAEIARLACDEPLRRQLDQVIRNHKHELHWSSSDWVIPIALLIGSFMACWLLWPFLS